MRGELAGPFTIEFPSKVRCHFPLYPQIEEFVFHSPKLEEVSSASKTIIHPSPFADPPEELLLVLQFPPEELPPHHPSDHHSMVYVAQTHCQLEIGSQSKGVPPH